MTAAHVVGMTVDCPNCRQPTGSICLSPDGHPRAIPCIDRTKLAGTYETSPQSPAPG